MSRICNHCKYLGLPEKYSETEKYKCKHPMVVKGRIYIRLAQRGVFPDDDIQPANTNVCPIQRESLTDALQGTVLGEVMAGSRKK
jgi:hypothetical protein